MRWKDLDKKSLLTDKRDLIARLKNFAGRQKLKKGLDLDYWRSRLRGKDLHDSKEKESREKNADKQS